MPDKPGKQSGEATILTLAVENIFRKLIRFLVGRISLVRLQEMIRYIYVEEAEKDLRTENPGKNVPMTRLALVTGLDTRTLVQVRKHLEAGAHQYRQQFLTELTPESAIVEAWNARVGGNGSARGSRLSYGSSDGEFERLVKSTISGRGITTRSIIERLLATGSVVQDKQNRTLELVVDQFSPYLSEDEPSMFNAALSSMSGLLSTLEHNLKAPKPERFFQRQIWTFRLNPKDRETFRRAMREQLEQYKDRTEASIEPWESAHYSEDLLTAGAGFYYFEDS
ncbi:MAG: hypothetical protein HKN57_15195 [Xanthomonadales bacterium]|nr:hypothetical protein [Gammaproteobacteria bacterium]MBT8053632.1 hypothetical protein [Gammaproteobacteria bacterium]NND58590.1 hypothetical protein [Xanthomonadales bacterium]NNK51020.1 hypothetical protein [Xanthomonadales bacterium]